MDLDNITKKEPLIFLICGKAQHGKSTLAGYLKDIYEEQGLKVVELQYAAYIKMYAMKYFGWDGSEETKPRELLQKLGTEVIREQIDPMFHVNRIMEDIEVLSYFYDVVIISDIRSPEEIETPKELFFKTVAIKVTRLDFEDGLAGDEKKHYTETALNDYDNYDYKIENTTLERLYMAAKYIVEEVGKRNES